MPYEGMYEPSLEGFEKARKIYQVADSRDEPLFDLRRLDRLMEGAIDIHIHPGPDAYSARLYNDIEIARQACDAGMGGVVFKCHSFPTSRSVILTQMVVDEYAREHGKKSPKIIGGVVLNYNVGGLNIEAVRSAQRLGSRFVWLPNLDSSHQFKMTGKTGGIEVLDKNSNVVPELVQIFKFIAEHDLVLSLGHHSSRERLIMIDTARELGVKRIEVVHPTQLAEKMTVEQMKMAADRGAYLGIYSLAFDPPQFVWEENLEVIKKVGADHIVLGTDLGSWRRPPPVSTFRTFLGLLLEKGIPENDVVKMSRLNAEKLIFNLKPGFPLATGQIEKET